MRHGEKVWQENITFREVIRKLYEILDILTEVHGSETWSLSAQERRKVELFEMMC